MKFMLPILIACAVLGVRPFGLTIILCSYFIFCIFLVKHFGASVYKSLSTFDLCSCSIMLVVIFQVFFYRRLDLVQLVYYSPFIFTPYFSRFFRESFRSEGQSIVATFFRYIIYLSLIQLVLQLLQLGASLLSLNLDSLNKWIVPVADYSQSVFLNAGLPMNRFSGMFNQPLDAGLFWYSSFIMFTAYYWAVRSDVLVSPSRLVDQWRSLYIFVCLVGCSLCGSKIFFMMLPFVLYIVLHRFVKFIRLLKMKKNFIYIGIFLLPLFFKAVTEISDFLSKNPLFHVFLFGNPSNYFSLYHLTAGRITDDGVALKFSDDLLTLFGTGYHNIIYDNGYLYMLKHIGLVGVACFLGLCISAFKIEDLFNGIVSLRMLLRIYLCFSIFFIAVGGSILTLHKSSILFLLVLCFVREVIVHSSVLQRKNRVIVGY